MSRLWLLILILLLIGSPVPQLYAVGMGGMGGVAGMVDKISIQTKSVGPVDFSHSRHAFKCDVCHPSIFKKKNNSNHVTMEMMEQGRSCGACHNGKQAFSVTGDCVTCHAGDIAIKTKSVGVATFSHEVHVDMFGCDDCHPDLYKPRNNSNHATMDAMADGESCGACHDGDTAFGVTGDCAACHAGDILYKDEDNGNVVFPHTAHIDMFGCDECHPDLYKPKRGANRASMEDMENGESCGACHDGDTAFGVAEDCDSCHEM